MGRWWRYKWITFHPSLTVTRLSEMNVEPHVTERMLGHELGGIMSVYNKHDWIEAQRKAYELHADKLFWHIRSIFD
ncbi:hypothetical protein AWP91_08545 [Escherichia coli]|nr:hypothetical protein AWP91_08545 [Escherichia coli]